MKRYYPRGPEGLEMVEDPYGAFVRIEDHDAALAHHQRRGNYAMTREQAIEIARRCAKAKPQSYYAEPFQPHEWVIDAIIAAAEQSRTAA